MTIVEHLEELRDRLIVIVIALVVSTVFSFVFTDQFLDALIRLMGDLRPTAIAPVEPFLVWFRVALIAGVALAMPVIIYEVVRFLLPALTPQERRYLLFLVPGGTLSFVIGLVFAFAVVLPAAIGFLGSFQPNILKHWTIDSYISFVTTIMFWMGVIFQLPLVMFFLGKLRILSSAKLLNFFRYWIVVAAVIAAMVTPTPDPVNMAIVMVPLIGLYGVGILLTKLAER
jgi:sec-independent protein translocase protein TatC